ncbi:hypothetical protein BS47DRAFT_1359505 [Hydnum rufescens UP504]|uniref:Uncharacterized protein n=1 Tax=Hydnum rufescens UP504 TaxID=1448309 RepID=A0A9P6B7K7_9AGAM|nr:hypothetical protein BS47DRAFT_1359505 [Hydnum rufescens UP504]
MNRECATTPIEGSMPGQSSNEDNSGRKYLLLPPEEGSTREGASQDTGPTSLVCIISKSEDSAATYNQSTKQLLETVYTRRGSCDPATIGEVPPIIHEVLALLNKECSKLRNVSTSKTKRKLFSIPYSDDSWSVEGLQEIAETSREPYPQKELDWNRALEALSNSTYTRTGTASPGAEDIKSSISISASYLNEIQAAPEGCGSPGWSAVQGGIVKTNIVTAGFPTKSQGTGTMPIKQSVGGDLGLWNSRDTVTSTGCRTENARDEQLPGHSTVRKPEELRYSAINEKPPDNELGGDRKADSGNHQGLDRIDAQLIIEAAGDIKSCIQSKGTQAVVRTIEKHAGLQPYNASNAGALPNSSGRGDRGLSYSRATGVTESTNQAPIASMTDYQTKDMWYNTLGLPDNVSVTQVMIGEAYYHTSKPTGAQSYVQSEESKSLSPQEPEELQYSAINQKPPDNGIKGAHVPEKLASTILEPYLISTQPKADSGNHWDPDTLDKQGVIEVANKPSGVESRIEFEELGGSLPKRTRATIRTIEQEAEVPPHTDDFIQLSNFSSRKRGESSCSHATNATKSTDQTLVISATDYRAGDKKHITLRLPDNISSTQAAMGGACYYIGSESGERQLAVEVASNVESCVESKELSESLLKRARATVRMIEWRTEFQLDTDDLTKLPSSSSTRKKRKSHCSHEVIRASPNLKRTSKVTGTTDCRVKAGRYVTLDSSNNVSSSHVTPWDPYHLDDGSEE